MAIKHRNAVAKADFEDALDYLGLSVSEVAKRTGIPRAYLSDLKNRNVRLRREHEDKLRAHLEDEGVEFEEPGDADQVRPPAPPPPHPSVETAVVLRRSLSLADSLEDDQIAEALDAQADRDARLSELLRQKIAREEVLLGLAPSKYTDEFKASVEEARRRELLPDRRPARPARIHADRRRRRAGNTWRAARPRASRRARSRWTRADRDRPARPRVSAGPQESGRLAVT